MAREAGKGLRVAARIGLCALVALLVAVPIGLAARDTHHTHHHTGCPNAQARPGQASLGQVRHAIGCLIDRLRAKRGVVPVARNADLNRIAQAHTRVMLSQDCFRHRCDAERPLSRRLHRSGYLKGAKRWRYAEDLGYESTPREMVTRWLHRRYDRGNLLDPAFRDVGIGVGRGTPVPSLKDHRYLTYTLDLARRRP